MCQIKRSEWIQWHVQKIKSLGCCFCHFYKVTIIFILIGHTTINDHFIELWFNIYILEAEGKTIKHDGNLSYAYIYGMIIKVAVLPRSFSRCQCIHSNCRCLQPSLSGESSTLSFPRMCVIEKANPQLRARSARGRCGEKAGSSNPLHLCRWRQALAAGQTINVFPEEEACELSKGW